MGTPTEDALVGRRVGGRYELLERIGESAVAVIFRARDHGADGQTVAVKVVPTDRFDSPDDEARFRHEAKTASRLDHPGIARVLDWGIADDHHYLVMEHVDGEDLYDRLRREGRLSPPRALETAMTVLEALELAHGRGVIHRDLKPENVMIDRTERVRLLDFGVAKVEPQQGDDATVPNPVTRAGATVGTPSHMAPEQATGGKVDARTDLYAVGVLLYEMVTGRLPFEGKNDVQMAAKQVHDPPTPPSKHLPELDERLEGTILRALEKQPVRRPDSAHAMRAELAERLAELEEDDDELPTQTVDRPAAITLEKAPESEIPTREAARSVLDSRSGARAGAMTITDAVTVDQNGPTSMDEPTISYREPPQSEGATPVRERPERRGPERPERRGPGGTLVQEEEEAIDDVRQAVQQARAEVEAGESWTPTGAVPASAPVPLSPASEPVPLGKPASAPPRSEVPSHSEIRPASEPRSRGDHDSEDPRGDLESLLRRMGPQRRSWAAIVTVGLLVVAAIAGLVWALAW